MLNRVKGWFTHNIFYKVLSVIFAFVIWIVIVNIIDPDTTRTIYDIPVVIQNEDAVADGSHTYQIISGETASITIAGARSIVNTLDASDFNASADFSEMSLTGAVPIVVSLTSANSRYSSRITISINTTSMLLEVENISETVRMVELEYTGELAEDLVIDSLTAEPESITVSGSESALENIARAAVEIDCSEITDTGYYYAEPVIYDADGNVVEKDQLLIDCDTVAVYAVVSHIKQIPLEFSVGGEPAEGYEVSGTSSSVEYVNIKGSKDAIDKVSSIEIGAEVLDVSGKAAGFTVTVDLTAYLPDDVELYGESSTLTVGVTIVKSPDTEEVP